MVRGDLHLALALHLDARRGLLQVRVRVVHLEVGHVGAHLGGGQSLCVDQPGLHQRRHGLGVRIHSAPGLVYAREQLVVLPVVLYHLATLLGVRQSRHAAPLEEGHNGRLAEQHLDKGRGRRANGGGSGSGRSS